MKRTLLKIDIGVLFCQKFQSVVSKLKIGLWLKYRVCEFLAQLFFCKCRLFSINGAVRVCKILDIYYLFVFKLEINLEKCIVLITSKGRSENMLP